MTRPSPSPATTRTAPSISELLRRTAGQRTYFLGSDHATGVAIQDDGKIVVVGDAVDSFTPASAFAVARYNPNGSPDRSFSGDGKQTTSFPDYAGANAVALQG